MQARGGAMDMAMNRRIQQVLDGELPADRLTDEEAGELAAARLAVAETVAHVAAGEPVPDVTGAVMWRIAHGAPAPEAAGRRFSGPARQLLGWFWQPRAVRLRPAVALAAGVLVLAGGWGLARAGRGSAPVALESPSVPQVVQFRFSAPAAREVVLVGDFDGWEGRRLEQVAPGVWSTTVLLEPGVYDYAFLVDGSTWVLDPLAPTVSDGFGGANSRLSVLAAERPART